MDTSDRFRFDAINTAIWLTIFCMMGGTGYGMFWAVKTLVRVHWAH